MTLITAAPADTSPETNYDAPDLYSLIFDKTRMEHLNTQGFDVDKPILVQGETDISLSYEEICTRGWEIGRGLLTCSDEVGQIVAVLGPNDINIVPLTYGMFYSGAALVLLNPMLPKEVLSYQLQDSGADLFIIHTSLFDQGLAAAMECNTPVSFFGPRDPELDELQCLHVNDLFIDESVDIPRPQVQKHNLAMISYTSGTTGLPKGAQLTHGNLIHAITQLSVGESSDHNTLIMIPTTHIYGFIVLHGHLYLRNPTTLLHTPPNPTHILPLLAAHKISHVPMLPAMVPLLLHPAAATFNLTALRDLYIAAATLPPDLHTALRTAYPDLLIRGGYGMTETSCGLIHQTPGSLPGTEGTQGYLLPGLQAELCRLDGTPTGRSTGFGVLWVRGPCVFHGYRNREELNTRIFDVDGFFCTEDVVERREDGAVRYVCRADEVVVVKGGKRWVAPEEVERVVDGLAGVEESVMVRTRRGECAVLVKLGEGVEGGVDVLTGIMEAANEQLEAEGVEGVEVLVICRVGKVERSPLGKVLRKRMVDKYV